MEEVLRADVMRGVCAGRWASWDEQRHFGDNRGHRRNDENENPRSEIEKEFSSQVNDLGPSRACRAAIRALGDCVDRLSSQKGSTAMARKKSSSATRLYRFRDGGYAATIMDDLDVHVSLAGVITIHGPIGAVLQIDLEDASELAEVLAEIATLQRTPAGVRRAGMKRRD